MRNKTVLTSTKVFNRQRAISEVAAYFNCWHHTLY